ncbi:MAG TPA: hypothetical protein VGN85_00435 [Methyloceanibacter sp.]|nr:hypothetical protein [Methyloceanibacter sp.]
MGTGPAGILGVVLIVVLLVLLGRPEGADSVAVGRKRVR